MSAPRSGPGRLWPRKRAVLGVGVSETTYDEAVAIIIEAALAGEHAIVTALPVHGVVTAARSPALAGKIATFELVAPDGQPVRWVMNALHRTRLADRVYGPELMTRLCRRAAEVGLGVYLYGSAPHVVAALRRNLLRRFPGLHVAGFESPPFRPLTPAEDHAVVGRIREAGARLVFVGLGCPLQDEFAFAHRSSIPGVQVCVGAAFDFHAGTKRMAPRWMQERGLEWLFRLIQEPRRLWRRYCVTNGIFLASSSLELLRVRLRRASP